MRQGCKHRRKEVGRTIWLSCMVESRTSFPIPIVIWVHGYMTHEGTLQKMKHE